MALTSLYINFVRSKFRSSLVWAARVGRKTGSSTGGDSTGPRTPTTPAPSPPPRGIAASS